MTAASDSAPTTQPPLQAKGSGPPKPRRGKSLFRSFRDATVILLIVLAVRILDPLGIDDSLTERVQDIVVRVLSGWYPATGQNQITVVIIDDAFLKSRRTNWPLPLSDHGQILAKLQEAGARSIFVDMVYGTERGAEGSAAALGKLIEDIRTGHPAAAGRPAIPGIPVLLGDILKPDMPARRCSDRDLPNGAVLPEIACAASAVVPVKLPMTHATYPATVTAYPCSAAWPTPAFAQFDMLQSPEPLGCASQFSERPPLFVVWGHAISANMAGREAYRNCRFRQDNRTILDVAEMVLRGLFVGLDRRLSDKLRCEYNDTIQASALFDNSPQGQASLRRFIANRNVLVGTDMSGEADRFTSPIQGDVPGVYFHAMALDNLITAGFAGGDTSGVNYLHADERSFLGSDLDAWIASLVIAAWIASEHLADMLVVFISERHARASGSRKQPKAGLIWPFSFPVRAIVLLALLFLVWYWDLLALQAALGIALTVLVVEFSLKIAMGVLFFSSESAHEDEAHENGAAQTGNH